MSDVHLPLLKKVARSFYLTIRFLPSRLRESVALAYLLARASDTIADENLSSHSTAAALDLVTSVLAPSSTSCTLSCSASSAPCPSSAAATLKAGLKDESFLSNAERELLGQLSSLVEELNDSKRNSFDADAIKLLWQTILEGQLWDLKKFSSQEAKMIVTPEELDHYLYLVAGCVGEFWTKLAAHYFPDFSKEPLVAMMEWGINYGKGLQLTNMLRDWHEDMRQDRCYFNEAQIPEMQVKALNYLQQGRCYLKALRPGRLKYASALPLLLAEETLPLVIKKGYQEKTKVSRCTVYITLLRALPLLIF